MLPLSGSSQRCRCRILPPSLEQALVLNVSLWIFAACGVLLCLGGHTQGSNRPRELGSEEAAGMGLEGSGITAER